ncbi:hypothetical protein [Limnochorda pilosa]|uniref:Uncharacterized protein n=1 Tax=Limnochorda pilosa TaxID=1555112 RepID=A0A0K2SPM9_LIMPI|nr:hypothetical protein [Limnochorda pilosa]BAS28779.1 hypothetical protein LIP_2950 [Limnochorda pilosa]
MIFEGGPAASLPERMMQQAREGMVLDRIEQARRIHALDRSILVTDRPEMARHAEALGAHVHLTGSEPFHFGKTLRDVVLRHALDAVLYVGGGAAPLAHTLELGQIASLLKRSEPFVAANNYHSADVVAFAPARSVLEAELPPIDNLLPQALEEAGLPYRPLPRSLGINFDVDTPSDLMVLAVHPGVGRRTAAALARLGLELDRVRLARDRLMSRESDVLIFGRVGGPLFAYLDETTHCRLRLFSEERGMKALGREARGEVTSLIGFLVDEVGPAGFIDRLTRLADAAFVDTRVLWAHRRSTPSAADRFYSDLLLPDAIEDPFTQELTRAAREAPIPVLLGGHSLVAGGVWALMDAALRNKQELPAVPRI